MDEIVANASIAIHVLSGGNVQVDGWNVLYLWRPMEKIIGMIIALLVIFEIEP